MLGAKCEFGEDKSREGLEGYKPHQGKSFLAFDFKRELLLIKATLVLPSESLPPALRPLDAELSFDDIASQGIRVHHVRPNNPHTGAVNFQVTVTVTCRRPPKFYTAFEPTREMRLQKSRRLPWRRRTTAMDFAISGVVRGCLNYSLYAQPERDAGAIKAVPEGPTAYVSMIPMRTLIESRRIGTRTRGLSFSRQTGSTFSVDVRANSGCL